MIIAPILHTLSTSPWLTVLLLGTLVFSWVMFLVLWLTIDKRNGWL